MRAIALLLALALCGRGSAAGLPQKGLVMHFEAGQGVKADSNGQVLQWEDLTEEHTATANKTAGANREQRKSNSLTDKSLLNEEGHGVPARAAAHQKTAGLSDSAPFLVKDKNGIAAVDFDGDDYLRVEGSYLLMPLNKGFTIVTAIAPHGQDKAAPRHMAFWMGMGNPGFYSDAQYSLTTSATDKETRFVLRLTPIAHDEMRPTVRDGALISARANEKEPNVLSFVMDGKRVTGRLNGNSKAFAPGADGLGADTGEQEGVMSDTDDDTYGASIDVTADFFGEMDFWFGTGPSAEDHLLYTGEGCDGKLYATLLYKRQLKPAEVRAAEQYLACKVGHTMCKNPKAEL